MASPLRVIRPYQYMSTQELLTLLGVSKLMTQEWFVKRSTELLTMSQRVIGTRATNFYVKHGVASVFSAGETVGELRNTIDRMQVYPFYPIVDFAAEGVEDIEQTSDMDNNASQVILGIIEAGKSRNSAAAVKFTALTGTPLLQKLSLLQSRANSHLLSLGVIKREVDGLFQGSLFPHLAAPGSKLASVYSHPAVARLLSDLSEVDKRRAQEFIGRAERVVQAGEASKVAVLIDAEQTYFQPAVDALTFDLQRMYNKEKGIVQNTFQCYLKQMDEKVSAYVRASWESGIFLGAKLVRGAYMIEENRLASKAGIESPIQPTKAATDACYNASLTHMIASMRLGDELTIASHNPDSVALGQQLMSSHGMSKLRGGVSFAQLMGMKHQLSVSLAESGYITQKYLPWGPINRLIPYLSRRAHESFGLRDQIQEQVSQIKGEIKQRLLA